MIKTCRTYRCDVFSCKFKQKRDRRLQTPEHKTALHFFTGQFWENSILIFGREWSFSILPAIDYKLHKGRQLLNPRAAQGT